MSPSDEFFQPQEPQPQPQQQPRRYPAESLSTPPTSPTATTRPQPINIPQSSSGSSSSQRRPGRRNSVSVRSAASSLPTTSTMACLLSSSYDAGAGGKVIGIGSLVETEEETTESEVERTTLPSSSTPSTTSWKRTTGFSKPLTRARTMTMVVDDTPYPDLPADVRSWTSNHVAEYLGYSLRFYPKPITQDLGRYVRQRMEINLKWRSMILKAVGMLRRETLRASRVDKVNWEDGYDADKDGALLPSPRAQASFEDLSEQEQQGATTTTESCPTETDLVQEPTSSSISSADKGKGKAVDRTAAAAGPRQREREGDNIQNLRRGMVDDITGVLQSWKREQEARWATGLGFAEGIVFGGMAVALMMKFTR
ncbi:hypothetical protein BGX31_011078 [Mortierella sp. GBA43]|nr:hypothetical protein BGX31_011078 [Mortierella sp. GBA43]